MRLAAAFVLLLALAGCSGGHTHSVHGYGLAVDLPRGWTGEVYRRGSDLAILHAASFRLGPHDGYDPLGTIERRDRLVDARRGMRRDDVGIGIFAYAHVPGPSAPALEGDLTVRPSDRKDMEGYPSARAVYERTFSDSGRQVQVVVEFGARDATPDGLDRVNRVLRTLTVGAD